MTPKMDYLPLKHILMLQGNDNKVNVCDKPCLWLNNLQQTECYKQEEGVFQHFRSFL